MNLFAQYGDSVAFLSNLDDDWARLVDLVGPCRHDPKAAREPYKALVRAIAYQQLTAKAGDAIIGRLKALFEERQFPHPEDLVAADFDMMRTRGFSASKIATIKAIAAGALTGVVPTREVAATMDDETLINQMVAIKGVGRWTVEMLLTNVFAGADDVLPADDFGVREGYRSLKALPEQPKPRELRRISEACAPHRTVASWYLWRIPRERGNVLK
jgi:DNA-3-methyladenine glycosylase II